jgi:predicted PurR-regulated permease PerM
MTDQSQSESSAADSKVDRTSQVEATGLDSRFGELGEPFDRRSPFRIGVVGGLGLAVAYVFWVGITAAAGVLLLMVLALVIGIGLDPVVTQVQRLGVPRWVGVAVVSLAALAVLGVFLALAIPPIANEVNALVKSAPNYLQSLQRKNSVLGRLNRQFHLVTDLKKALSTGGVSAVGSGIVGAGRTALGVVSGILIVVVLTIYFLADVPRIKRNLVRLTPHTRRARAAALIDEAFARVGGYVLGNVLTSVIAGLGTLIWLEIFSVPYPALLAIFVGLLDLIPIVGSAIAGFIVALVALTVSLPIALATAGFYIVYRNAEDYLITPRIMRRTVRVPGLVTVVAVLIGGALLGIIGALVSIPVAAIIQLIVEEVVYPRMDVS